MSEAPQRPRSARVAVGWLVAAVLLLAAGAWCLSRGVDVRQTTAGLLATPVRQTRLHGQWLTGATVALVAAVIVAVEGVSRLRARA